MSRANDAVKFFCLAGGEGDFIFCADGRNRITFLDAVREGRNELFEILLRAAHDRSPWVLGVEAKEAMIMPKAHQGDGREPVDLFGWA